MIFKNSFQKLFYYIFLNENSLENGKYYLLNFMFLNIFNK